MFTGQQVSMVISTLGFVPVQGLTTRRISAQISVEESPLSLRDELTLFRVALSVVDDYNSQLYDNQKKYEGE